MVWYKVAINAVKSMCYKDTNDNRMHFGELVPLKSHRFAYRWSIEPEDETIHQSIHEVPSKHLVERVRSFLRVQIHANSARF